MRDIIAIGGSAGGIGPLQMLLQELPERLPASIFVIVHRMSSSGADGLVELLRRSCKLPVASATHDLAPERGRVYVGAANAHLRLVDGRFRAGEALDLAPNRGSINALFRSIADCYGPRSIGVVLSGALDDGTLGLWEIRRAGGIAIVQDPSASTFSSMPAHAMDEVPLHYCLAPEKIARTLVDLVTDARPAASRTRVLIVEDEWVLAHELERCLADLGYDVVGLVQSGEQALRTAAETSTDIAVMDIQLAGAMRGTEAARALWDSHRIPSVFLTAYSDESTVREATTMSAGFVVKPFRAPQLHAAIQMAMDRRTVTTR